MRNVFSQGVRGAALLAGSVLLALTSFGALAAACNAKTANIYQATNKSYKAMAALNKNYFKNSTLTSTSPTTANADCAKLCGNAGEPAPCAWFSVTKWLTTNTATRKDSISYQCHMFNDRNLKQITTPSLPKGDNLGSPSNPARFQEAWTYACRV